MNELQIFNNEEFGALEITTINGKPYFPATKSAEMLGYSKPHDAITRHCRYSAKHGVPHPQNPDKTIEMNFIPEGDLYRLIARSELPGAERFESWIFDEILPAIRKHGVYATADKIEEMLSDPDTMIKTLLKLKEEKVKRLEAEATIEKQAPKVLFADAVEASHNTILVGDLAKLLKQNGVDIGQNRLFERLRSDGFLIRRKGTDYNMPTQKAMELGLFKVKETAITHADGHVSVNRTTKVTGKGQLYFINKYVNAHLPGLLKGVHET